MTIPLFEVIGNSIRPLPTPRAGATPMKWCLIGPRAPGCNPLIREIAKRLCWLLPMCSLDGRTAIRARILSFVVSRHSWQAREQALAEERRDPAVRLGERRALEARRVVEQLGEGARQPGRKRREQGAVAPVWEIEEPHARCARAQHALAVESRYQPFVLPGGDGRKRRARSGVGLHCDVEGR